MKIVYYETVPTYLLKLCILFRSCLIESNVYPFPIQTDCVTSLLTNRNDRIFVNYMLLYMRLFMNILTYVVILAKYYHIKALVYYLKYLNKTQFEQWYSKWFLYFICNGMLIVIMYHPEATRYISVHTEVVCNNLSI